MEALVKSCILVGLDQACQPFSKITVPISLSKSQYLWEGLCYFVYLFHVVTHIWKLQCYHVILVGYGPACPKFSEITNCQYLWKGLSDFVDFLHAVICILLVIHSNYKNMLSWVGIVRHGLSANQIVRCFKLKKHENYIRCQVDFLLPLKVQKISCYFVL